jgi:hypothetical protein
VKRRLRRLIVFAGVLGLVMAMNVGAAFAHPENAPFTDDPNGAVVFAPVGSVLQPSVGTHPGNNGAFVGIDNNPNCPLHYPHP